MRTRLTIPSVWPPDKSCRTTSPERLGIDGREAVSVLLFDLRLGRKFTFCDRSRQFAEGECKMDDVDGKSRADFRWTLSCATMGRAVSASLCFAQGNQGVPHEMQRLQEMQRLVTAPPATATPWREFLCDSRVPEGCLDIYRRRMEQAPKRILYDERWAGGARIFAPLPQTLGELCRGTRPP